MKKMNLKRIFNWLYAKMLDRAMSDRRPREDRETISPVYRLVSVPYVSRVSLIALLLLVLGGWNTQAWAAWPTYSGSCNTSGYVVYNVNKELNTIDSEEIDLAGPGYEVSFDAKHTWSGVGDLKVAQLVDGKWSGAIWSKNPGKATKNKWGITTGYDYEYYVVETKLDPRATKIKFYTEAGATLYKTIQNIRVTRYSDNAYKLYTSPVDCGSAAYNTSASEANYTTGNAYVDWSHSTTLPTCTITGTNASYFEIQTKTTTPQNNKFGTMTVKVAYKHTAPGDHLATLKVGDKTITVKGHTDKIIPYITTDPTVAAITYGDKISNSQITEGVVKANLSNGTTVTVPGKWTIDENGQTVTTSGGSNATVNLTFTPTDGNTYNTIHTTQLMFVRSVATISWASAYSAEKPTIPVGKWIENAATTNAAGAVITYSSTNPNVEISADEHSFRFTAESEAEIVASHGVTATHGSASETKTFKSTYKAIQVIKWADRFDRLTTEMTTKPLVAEVWIENALTGVRTYSAERTALLQYSSANSSVVSIPNNSTSLHIEGKGTTTITAFVEGDEYYEEASVTMPVKVREPSDGCDYPLWEKDHEGDKDHLYEFFQMNKDEIISPEYDIRMEGQYPDKLSFSHKGEYYNVVGLSFWKYYSGPIKAQQKIGNNWVNVTGSEVTPALSDWQETSDLQLDERATHIRFVRPQGGEGHHYIKNVTVSRKHFIRTETPEVDFGNTIKVNSSEYRDVVINYANVQDVLKVTNPFSKDVTVEDVIDVDSCGAAGSAVLRIYFSPTSLATVDDYITIKDEVKNSTLSIHVKADAQRADQAITWNPEINILATESILLNGTTNGQEHGVMNVITYTVTNNDDVISVANNVVTILKPGTVTITATQKGSANYEAADPVEKNFTISAETLTIMESPVAGDITYGQTLSASTLTGGSVQDSKGNTVAGSFSWQAASTQPNAGSAQNFIVVFTPDENAAWYNTLTTSVDVNVAAAKPVATPSAANIVYGQKVSESVLSNEGTAGTWSWKDAKAEDVLPAGTYDDLAVHFTPSSGNYTELDGTVTLTVEKAEAEAVPAIAAITYGQKVSEATLTNTGATGGAWALVGVDANEVKDAGSYELNVHFTPTSSNYKEKNATVTLTVNKAASEATPSAAAIVEGQTVSASTLSNEGTAGSWAWDESAADDTPAVGTHEYTVHFTPENSNYTTLTTTVQLQVNALVYNFTNNKGDGDWSNPENWENGVVPASDPDVIVSGDLQIDEDMTVGSLTIQETGSVSVITNGTLTVNGVSEERTSYGDVHVKETGNLVLGNTAALKVHDFILDASLGGLDAEANNKTAMSGQVTNAEKIEKQGNAYFDLSFDPSGKISYGWYDFTVPFEVNIAGGIYRIGSTDDRLMVSGTHFLIMEADEANRANGGKGWKNKNSGVLQPGKLYTITFNYSKSFDQNTFRFMWNGNGSLSNGEKYNAQYAAGSEASLRGWNGMGNGMLRHGYPKGNYKMQMYNHSTNTYELIYGQKTFAVGSAFFVQVDVAGEISWKKDTATADRPLYAPSREGYEVEEFCLSLRQEDANAAADVLYFSASEEATEAYVIGHDLLKMGTPTDSKVARLWATKGGKKLCDVEAGLANNNAEAPLSIYAPQTGTYILSADEAPANTSLYLTYNDRVIWNLSYTPYTLDLTKGTTEGYGLKLYVNRITTDIDDVQGDQTQCTKVILDNQIYIVMPNGAMYDVTGKKVQ